MNMCIDISVNDANNDELIIVLEMITILIISIIIIIMIQVIIC